MLKNSNRVSRQLLQRGVHPMNGLRMLMILYGLGWLNAIACENCQAAEKPNIVYIICDDLGYGDVHCLAPETCRISTPNADRLASQGMIFTDAHSGSSVCSPTRYGLMTGRYSWRTRLQKGVVTGFAPSLIDEARPTVASFLKQQGYHTAIIGKWHLDFEYLDPRTGKPYRQKDYKQPPVGAKIPDGPVHRGFDYYHGFHHARNMEAVIENETVIEHDEVINMLPRLTRKSVEYLDSRAGNSQPFFLYVPLGSPHTPIVPSPEWQGKSGLGEYGDFVMQTDHALVEISAALERNGQTENTLVIFTSDNGCSKAAGIEKLAAQGHIVSAHLRGSKADLWDGGHRVPFLVRWPGHVKAGTQSDQLICHIDLFATLAEITGKELPAGSAEDSVSILPALSGQPITSTRHGVIHHSVSGHFAYRQGNWKLLLAKASGGWTSPTEKEAPEDALPGQLYDMTADVGEQHNLYQEKPEIVSQLLKLLKEDIQRGRSTTGPKSANDVNRIELWKSGAPKSGKAQ
ncbi:MAG: arylsulfatase [Planctomycetaceae bacterium]|nr:arylsulfatase [Planctomycetaceae bacterium]